MHSPALMARLVAAAHERLKPSISCNVISLGIGLPRPVSEVDYVEQSFLSDTLFVSVGDC
jgi:hypothetical protein